MYDTVKFEADCWKCGKPLHGFQSKDGDQELDIILPKKIAGGSFYAMCSDPKCLAWNWYDVIAKKIEVIFNERESKLRTK